MKSLAKLGIIGGTTLTSLSGIAYIGSNYFSSPKEEIGKLIEKEFTHILLKTETNQDSEQWRKNWKSYKEKNLNQDKDIFGLQGWKSDGSVDLTEKLKKKCNSLKSSKVDSKDDEIYKNVTIYCARYVTVEDDAKRKELIVLDTSVSDTTTGFWAEKNKAKDNLKTSIERLGIAFTSVNADAIKNGCKTAKNNSKELRNYEEIYRSYVDVCTNPKAE